MDRNIESIEKAFNELKREGYVDFFKQLIAFIGEEASKPIEEIDGELLTYCVRLYLVFYQKTTILRKSEYNK